MPITPYLNGHYVDAETKRVMGVALELARSALRVPDRSDAITGMIAEKIIALAQAGERNPDLLCEHALKDLQAVIGADNRAAASSKPEGG
jgi:hypothetical protein